MKLDETEARQRFAAARTARLATVDEHGRPHLVPIVFAVEGATVAFAVDGKPKTTRDLRRLRNIAANPTVSLLVDHYAEDWTQLWWVRADGRATILTDEQAAERPLARLVAKYPQYQDTRPAGPVVLIGVDRWTGWSGAA
ncbi:MAG TPA: TIGR03668 family PPOX class F420-dependent oxidoreductase [Pseudonocardiaceae bacterium]|jgi:PPOX class probable F420-dependent enzyme|nr:TIGR03668 family PPOX class F420-dependent oxidoreductase [Pseudonocardiaceae bacterium]